MATLHAITCNITKEYIILINSFRHKFLTLLVPDLHYGHDECNHCYMYLMKLLVNNICTCSYKLLLTSDLLTIEGYCLHKF